MTFNETMAESSESIQTSKLTSRADIVADEAQFVDAIGLAIDLYQVSVQLLEQQWHGIKTSPDLWTTEQRTKMAYCLSQVRLWGSGFSQGDLRQCLEGSTYLASSLIEVLSALAKVIVAEGTLFHISQARKDPSQLVIKSDNLSPQILHGFCL